MTVRFRPARPATLIAVLASALAAAALDPGWLHAQSRPTERHDRSTAAGRLMGFYSDAVAFSPAGTPRSYQPWTVEAGVEASYVPRLSAAQRTAGSDKPEATNLAPVFPRPRAVLALPYRLTVEGSWVPPLRVFGVTANLLGVAVAWRGARVGAVDVVPRLSALTGRVRGPITCNEETAGRSIDLRVYYDAVCYGRDSDDYFSPRHLTGEVVATGAVGRTLRPYAGVGLRRERVRFDIGVIRPDGVRDPEHPVLVTTATRAFLTGGLTWLAGPRAVTSGEVYYAPGSLVTVRLAAALRVHQ